MGAKSQPATCGNCEHSLVMTGVPQFDYTGRHFLCGYETPLDSNLPGEVVGLTNFRPDWCPAKVDLIQREFEVNDVSKEETKANSTRSA